MERWFSRHIVEQGDCWIWTGHRDRNGYGSSRINRKNAPVHRVTYEYFIVEVPDGLELDHLCRNRSCVNPWHLEPVTRAINMQRAVGCGQYDRSRRPDPNRTHCSKRHRLVGDNVYISSRGNKSCRSCQRDNARAIQKRKAALGGAS